MVGRRALESLAVIALLSGCTAQPEPVNPTSSPRRPSEAPVSTARPDTPAPPSDRPASKAPVASEAPVEPPPPTIPSAADPFVQLERDGIRLSLQVEQNPLPAGAVTSARTVLTNESNRVLHWVTGTCDRAVSVGGSLPETAWRGGTRPASDQLDTFKHLALDGIEAGQPEFIGFLPESVRQDIDVEDFGCGDIAHGHDLEPGASVVERSRWDGTVMFAHSPASAGRLDIVATFGTWWRGADTPEHRGQPLELHLDAWVAGVVDPPRLDPAEAIDAAIADPVFAAWLETRGDLRNAQRPFVRYDAGRHIWRVGLIHYNPTRTRVCNVDADTGEVVSITGSAE